MRSEKPVYKPKEVITLHESIRFNKDLSFGEKLFYAEIESMSKDEPCSFSSRCMSKYFGVSHQTILNWTLRMSKMGLLELITDPEKPFHRQLIRTLPAPSLLAS